MSRAPDTRNHHELQQGKFGPAQFGRPARRQCPPEVIVEGDTGGRLFLILPSDFVKSAIPRVAGGFASNFIYGQHELLRWPPRCSLSFTTGFWPSRNSSTCAPVLLSSVPLPRCGAAAGCWQCSGLGHGQPRGNITPCRGCRPPPFTSCPPGPGNALRAISLLLPAQRCAGHGGRRSGGLPSRRSCPMLPLHQGDRVPGLAALPPSSWQRTLHLVSRIP